MESWNVEIHLKVEIKGPIDLLSLGEVISRMGLNLIPASPDIANGVKIGQVEITQWDIE